MKKLDISAVELLEPEGDTDIDAALDRFLRIVAQIQARHIKEQQLESQTTNAA